MKVVVELECKKNYDIIVCGERFFDRFGKWEE